MDAQDKELLQLNDDIICDVNSLVDKYMTIVSLDVPENDEQLAQQKILTIIKKAINEIEGNN